MKIIKKLLSFFRTGGQLQTEPEVQFGQIYNRESENFYKEKIRLESLTFSHRRKASATYFEAKGRHELVRSRRRFFGDRLPEFEELSDFEKGAYIDLILQEKNESKD